ncbi:unnamed protein product [Ectocarpus sp. 13 AM-2016]
MWFRLPQSNCTGPPFGPHVHPPSCAPTPFTPCPVRSVLDGSTRLRILRPQQRSI